MNLIILVLIAYVCAVLVFYMALENAMENENRNPFKPLLLVWAFIVSNVIYGYIAYCYLVGLG